MLHALVDVFLDLAPWMLLGAAISGLLHSLVPSQWIHRNLNGPSGVFKSVVVGVPLPLCSCGVIPVAMGLRRERASRGAVIGFLISTPQTGVDSILVSASFLGWPFALFKVAAAFVTGLVGGWFGDLTDSDADEAHEQQPTASADDRGWQASVGHSFTLIRSIYGWLLIGVIASALITTFSPQFDSLRTMNGSLVLLATLLFSIPLYVCATASVPIAAALVASGFPAGAALVFLMAGPATNVATLGAVYRTLGGRALATYLSTIIRGSIIAGLLFGTMVPTVPTSRLSHTHEVESWSVVSGGILAGIIFWFSFQDVRHWLRRFSSSQATAPRHILHITGMKCGACANRLERQLGNSDGVEQASVSFEDAQASVYSTLSDEELKQRIRGAGFEVDEETDSTHHRQFESFTQDSSQAT